MVKRKKSDANELLNDYDMLADMEKQLAMHQKNIMKIGNRVAKVAKTNMRDGLLENLDIVATHMRNATKEIEKAQKRLKRI
jgi:hypothetical protein